ncbi:cupin domain-containing protein [Streptomyces hoynatensis]|uniref:Cupin domain-containing protein n=1 Tax=Streptomyces hoynatensis TaxID=1141874 RepID=A0A3A9ZCF0_9ACTN|nr:cupin domain-containing protein [Streptomyces hoynatensis]RKN45007.1 cupin domain-containing protein [Streptomyces hoynatensis]
MTIALIRNPGEGTPYRYFSSVQEQVVSTTETEGAVTALRFTMRREDAPPLHVHTREDESWVILSGRVRFWIGSASLAECQVHDAGPGAYVYSSRNMPHTLQPLTKTAEILVINNPGAIEGYFRSVGAADARHDAAHAADLAAYGVSLLDDPPPHTP